MGGNEDQQDDESKRVPASPPEPLDLVDFHLRWRQFRPFALRAMETASEQIDRQTVEWLIALADRVNRNDLDADE